MRGVVPNHRPLSYEQAHRIATQSLPRLASTIYTGKIWGGVQIVDTFMRKSDEELLEMAVAGIYDGGYANSVDEAMDDLETLLTSSELEAMQAIAERGI
jgi:hypothetical protein